jgi:hypothetical protein
MVPREARYLVIGSAPPGVGVCQRPRPATAIGPFKLGPEEPEASFVRWLILAVTAAALAGAWWRQRADSGDERALSPRRGFTSATVPRWFTCPRLHVAPRDVVDEVAGTLGGQEVRLELEEFDRRFRVESEDGRFAVAFLDQRMMEALLGLPGDMRVDVNEDVLLLWAPKLPAEQVLLLFDAAAAIRRRIPRVVASLFPARPTRGPRERRWLQGRWSPESIGDA